MWRVSGMGAARQALGGPRRSSALWGSLSPVPPRCSPTRGQLPVAVAGTPDGPCASAPVHWSFGKGTWAVFGTATLTPKSWFWEFAPRCGFGLVPCPGLYQGMK